MTVERLNSSTAKQLKSIIDRIERLQEERDDLSIDIAEIYREAKGNGFNVKALKALISERKKRSRNPASYDADEADLDLYRSVLNGLATIKEDPPAEEPPLPPGREVDIPEGVVSAEDF